MSQPENRATVSLAAYPALLRRSMLPARAFALACAADRGQPAPTAPGYRLYWLADEVLGCRELPAGGEAFLVLGRHTHCDVVLDRNPTVALRHVLVGVTAPGGGAPLLRVLDLCSQDGFELSDGTVQRSVFARGPLIMRIGSYAIVALPVVPPLPGPRAPALALVPPDPGHPYRVAPAARLADPVARPDVRSRITILPAALELGEPLATPAEAPCARALQHGHLQVHADAPAPPTAWELTISSPRGRASLRVPSSALERGVLVGRDGRCADGGLRAALSVGVSRVHLLLLREGDRVLAIDLGSTQGTRVDLRPVRVATVPEAGASFVLGTSPAVRLRARAVRLD